MYACMYVCVSLYVCMYLCVFGMCNCEGFVSSCIERMYVCVCGCARAPVCTHLCVPWMCTKVYMAIRMHTFSFAVGDGDTV